MSDVEDTLRKALVGLPIANREVLYKMYFAPEEKPYIPLLNHKIMDEFADRGLLERKGLQKPTYLPIDDLREGLRSVLSADGHIIGVAPGEVAGASKHAPPASVKPTQKG